MSTADIIGSLIQNNYYSLADLEAAGLHRQTVHRLVQDGTFESPVQGIFNHRDKEVHPDDDLALIAKRYPDGVLSLYTSARFHNMTQAESGSLHMIHPASRKKALTLGDTFWLEITTLLTKSEKDLTVGICSHQISGVDVKIATPERTIIDMWRQSALGVTKGNRQVIITDENFFQSLSAFSELPGKKVADVVKLAMDLEMSGKSLESFTSTMKTFNSANQSRVF